MLDVELERKVIDLLNSLDSSTSVEQWKEKARKLLNVGSRASTNKITAKGCPPGAPPDFKGPWLWKGFLDSNKSNSSLKDAPAICTAKGIPPGFPPGFKGVWLWKGFNKEREDLSIATCKGVPPGMPPGFQGCWLWKGFTSTILCDSVLVSLNTTMKGVPPGHPPGFKGVWKWKGFGQQAVVMKTDPDLLSHTGKGVPPGKPPGHQGLWVWGGYGKQESTDVVSEVIVHGGMCKGRPPGAPPKYQGHWQWKGFSVEYNADTAGIDEDDQCSSSKGVPPGPPPGYGGVWEWSGYGRPKRKAAGPPPHPKEGDTIPCDRRFFQTKKGIPPGAPPNVSDSASYRVPDWAGKPHVRTCRSLGSSKTTIVMDDQGKKHLMRKVKIAVKVPPKVAVKVTAKESNENPVPPKGWVPIKRVLWTVLNAKRVKEGSIWYKHAQEKQKSLSQLLNYKMLQSQFFEDEEVMKKRMEEKLKLREQKEKASNKPVTKGVLDARTAQNLEIGLRGMGLLNDFAPIERAIVDLNDRQNPPEVASAESLVVLQTLIPNKEELNKLAEHVKEEGDTLLPLAEKFLLKCLNIPAFDLRMECCIIRHEYSSRYENLRDKLQIMNGCISSLLHSITEGTLNELLCILLAAGNYINYGTSKGNSVGIPLASLVVFKSISTLDSTSSLLRFVCSSLETKHGNEGMKELYDGLGKCKECLACGTFDDIESQLLELDNNVKKIKKYTSNPVLMQDTFFTNTFEGFYKISEEAIAHLRIVKDGAANKLVDLVQLTNERGKKPADGLPMLKYLADFWRDLKHALDENSHAIRRLGDIEKREQKKRDRLTKTTSPSNKTTPPLLEHGMTRKKDGKKRDSDSSRVSRESVKEDPNVTFEVPLETFRGAPPGRNGMRGKTYNRRSDEVNVITPRVHKTDSLRPLISPRNEIMETPRISKLDLSGLGKNVEWKPRATSREDGSRLKEDASRICGPKDRDPNIPYLCLSARGTTSMKHKPELFILSPPRGGPSVERISSTGSLTARGESARHDFASLHRSRYAKEAFSPSKLRSPVRNIKFSLSKNQDPKSTDDLLKEQLIAII